MRKYYVFILGFIFLVAMAYVGFWSYQSYVIKREIKKAFEDFSKDLVSKGGELKYSAIRVTGFPFHYRVDIEKPSITGNNAGLVTEVLCDEAISLSTNLKGTSYELNIPQIMVFNTIDSSGEKQSYKFEYKIPAVAILELAKAESKESGWKNFTSLSEIDFHNIESIYYKDSGSSFIDITNNKIVSESGKVILLYKNNKMTDGNRNIVVNIENEGFKLGDGYFLKLNKEVNIDHNNVERVTNILNKLGTSNSIINVSYLGSDFIHNPRHLPEGSVLLKQLSFNSGFFNLNLNGGINFTSDEPWPYGDITLKLAQLDNLIEYMTVIFTAGRPGIISDDYIKSLKTFIRRIADVADNSNDMTVTLKRERGNDIYIGKYNYAETVMLMNQIFQPVEKKEKPAIKKKPKQ